MRIAFVANTSWYLFNFRLNLMRVLLEKGHEVYAISPLDEYSNRLVAENVKFLDWKLSGAGVNPFVEFLSVLRLRRMLDRERMDMALTYTPKGNVYCGLAIIFSDRRLLPNVSGLGRVFSAGGWLSALVRMLYKFAFLRSYKVFFQNEDDRDLFVKARLLHQSKTERLMGSGVDLSKFQPTPLPCLATPRVGGVVFILVARLIWEKGVGQFVDAARLIKVSYPQTRFWILGKIPDESSGGVKKVDVERWEKEQLVEYLGTTDDVADVLNRVDCMVLPSYYREGVPRSLIEAAAMGRPCITTDMPGCRDVVRDGENGWLCAPRDVDDLKEKMTRFIEAGPDKKLKMGLAARRIAVELFDEQVIIKKYLAAIENIDKDSQ